MLKPGTGRSLALVALVSVCGAILLSCAKEPLQVDRNRPPETFLVAAPVDTSVMTIPYSYRIHLYWRGEDPDGFVAGFLWSWDDSSIGAFHYTTKTDSLFELTVNDSTQIANGIGNPQTSRGHTFYIRAVDNLGKEDPSLTIFNKRTATVKTEKPIVTFVGTYVPRTDGMIDTLCDGTPFQICWSGRDPDGFVKYYRFDIGSFTGPITSDSCAIFNQPGTTGSVALPSGLYTMTVSAIDNAFAVGKGNYLFVVNHDPETWFLPQGAPVGHYISHSRRGQEVNETGTFAQGDTVPYRSTVWWEWDGDDSHGGCERNCLHGWSFNLQPGTRDNAEPYIIGFLDTLVVGPPTIRFNNNNPGTLGQYGFVNLILDSLDAGTDMIARVASRDCSGRSDGTPASFRFNCNFPPTVDSLTVTPILANPENRPTGDEPCRLIAWRGLDYEDGLTESATVRIDDTLDYTLNGTPTNPYQSLIVADRTFMAQSSGSVHSVKVRVKDSAGIFSANTIRVEFQIGSP
jgi:hypothetical protein